MKKKLKKNQGITLIALIITIAILIIISAVSISAFSDSGIIGKVKNASGQHKKEEYKEQIKLAFLVSQYNVNSTSKEKFEEIAQKLQNNENISIESITVGSRFLAIKTMNGNEFTLLEDGTILEERKVILDIADGNIDLYENGYKQYTGELEKIRKSNIISYNGEYIITGTTLENVVRVCDIGIYNITLKNLNINVSSKKNTCAFNCNKGEKATDCFVNIYLEGENYLYGGRDAASLGFTRAISNTDSVTNGSTLTINGNGKLCAKSTGFGAGIGSGYTGFEAAAGEVNNIIINSGNIEAIATSHGCGIGYALNGTSKNITINGGNVIAKGNGYCSGISRKKCNN